MLNKSGGANDVKIETYVTNFNKNKNQTPHLGMSGRTKKQEAMGFFKP